MLRKTVIAVWLSLALAPCVFAQNVVGSGIFGDVKVGGGPPAFTGPGDIVTGAAAFWGLRAYSAATRGTPAITLCDDTGANCSNVSTNATTGALNNPGTHGTNNCATSGTCLISAIFDQSGAGNCSGSPCNATQATVAKMPALNFTCVGGQPCMVCNGSALVAPVPNSIPQPLTVIGVADRVTSGGLAPWYGDDNEQLEIGSFNVANEGYLFAGSFVTVSLSDNAFHAIQGVFNGASSTFNFDGTSATLNPGTASASSAHNICGDNNGNDRHFTGNLSEAGIWPIGFNSTQVTNVNANQHSFWGF
jgi:hypothetical protein